MPITPDTKNWTWVLERTCAECGYDASVVEDAAIGSLLRANAAAWPSVLQRAEVTVRPNDSTWSPLEYAAHVRDVYRLFLVRLNLMLDEDDPLFANWDQDATAIEERYNEQDPQAVGSDVIEAGTALADAFDAVSADAWARTGRRSDGARFTVSSFGKYLVHDPVHHLWDVTGRAFTQAD
jgi:hypothetical protein